MFNINKPILTFVQRCNSQTLNLNYLLDKIEEVQIILKILIKSPSNPYARYSSVDRISPFIYTSFPLYTKVAFGFGWKASVCVWRFLFFFFSFFFFDAWGLHYLGDIIYTLFMHCSRNPQLLYLKYIYIYILKMDPSVLFIHLKIILLQYFQFSIFSKISGIQTNPKWLFIFVSFEFQLCWNLIRG